MKMEPIEGSETSDIRTKTLGNYPKENIYYIKLILCGVPHGAFVVQLGGPRTQKLGTVPSTFRIRLYRLHSVSDQPRGLVVSLSDY